MKIYQLVFEFILLIWITGTQARSYIFPCYYVYEPHVLKPESIPATDLCTHIIILGCVTEQLDETLVAHVTRPHDCSVVLDKLAALKTRNPSLKLVMSMATNGDVMHSISKDPSLVEKFAQQAIRLAVEHHFDGLDLDWEYPCLGDDRHKFTYLLQRLRFYNDQYAAGLTLSAAIGAVKDTIDKCYDVAGLVNYLDYINVMCYDYNTIYNTYTAYSSPLFARPEETGTDLYLNSNFTINYLIDEYQVPRNKIVLGLNAGGHTFQLKSPGESNGFHASVWGVGYGSGWSRYSDLCKLMRTEGGVGVYDGIAQVLYAHYADQWANTGDVRGARVKSRWAKRMGLAGVFTWCLNWDDLDNDCGHNVRFPIHRSIHDELFKSKRI
jgi:chitinase